MPKETRTAISVLAEAVAWADRMADKGNPPMQTWVVPARQVLDAAKHPCETNGPANIVMLIDGYVRWSNLTDKEKHFFGNLRAEALATVQYMRQLEGYSPKLWAEVKKEAQS